LEQNVFNNTTFEFCKEAFEKEACVAKKHLKKWGSEDKRLWRSSEADVIRSTLIRSCPPEADVIRGS